MRPAGSSLLFWLIVALLLLLAWLTATGRLGKSRHGYAATARPPANLRMRSGQIPGQEACEQHAAARALIGGPARAAAG